MCGWERALTGEGVALAEGPGCLGLDPTGERLRPRGAWHPCGVEVPVVAPRARSRW